MSQEYGADQIQILEGLEAVRKRPGMYIGSTSSRGLHHLVYEIVDNSVDEALAGICDKIVVFINPDNSITVEDNGRGIPVGINHKSGLPGVEVVFTGQGGDSLFMEDESNGLACYNIGYEFLMSWAAEFHYKPLGIELVSPLAEKSIIDQISNLRIGMPEDSSKLWARHFFRDFLPYELSDYCYVADFFGLTLDGLEHAKPTIKHLFEESYELTQHHVFSSNEIKRMMQADVYSFEIKDYIDYCGRIAIAVWLHSIFREDRDE